MAIERMRPNATILIWGLPLLFLMGCGLMGCGAKPEGWTPVLQESSTPFLRTEVEKIEAQVAAARGDLPAEAEQTAKALAEADASLRRLLTYYLPLLEARERAYNAYRHHVLGEKLRTAEELDQIEKILMAVANEEEGRLLEEMQEPLEKLQNARTALEANPDEAAKALQALGTRLNFLVLKGGLVLGS